MSTERKVQFSAHAWAKEHGASAEGAPLHCVVSNISVGKTVLMNAIIHQFKRELLAGTALAPMVVEVESNQRIKRMYEGLLDFMFINVDKSTDEAAAYSPLRTMVMGRVPGLVEFGSNGFNRFLADVEAAEEEGNLDRFYRSGRGMVFWFVVKGEENSIKSTLKLIEKVKKLLPEARVGVVENLYAGQIDMLDDLRAEWTKLLVAAGLTTADKGGQFYITIGRAPCLPPGGFRQPFEVYIDNVKAGLEIARVQQRLGEICDERGDDGTGDPYAADCRQIMRNQKDFAAWAQQTAAAAQKVVNLWKADCADFGVKLPSAGKGKAA